MLAYANEATVRIAGVDNSALLIVEARGYEALNMRILADGHTSPPSCALPKNALAKWLVSRVSD